MWCLTEAGSRGLGNGVCCCVSWCDEHSLHPPAVFIHTDVRSPRSRKHCGQTHAARVSVRHLVDPQIKIIYSPSYNFKTIRQKKKTVWLNILEMFFLGYANIKGTFHFNILQALCECYLWMFSERSETINNI